MNKKIYVGTRILLGVIFLVFGLNGFFNFIPVPPMTDERVLAFFGGLTQSGYFFPFLKSVEVICGVLLLSNLYAPLALVVLAPIALNILLFHRMLAGGPPLDIIIVILLGLTAYGYRAAYRPMLQKKTKVA